MARKHQPMAIETLDEIQSAADRLGAWVQQNLRWVIAGVLAVLLLAGTVSYLARARSRTEKTASIALAETRNAYLSAMGAGPGALEVPKLANEEAARAIRAEYAERFAAVADAHSGTVSGALARMEVAQLAIEADETERALAVFEQILAEEPPSEPLRGLVLQAAAQALEQTERWVEAAERHQQAAELAGYPLRHWALADSARCLVAAGDRDAARALYARLDAEAPELRLPDHLRAQKREIEAAGSL
jgi:predicted negative regulator of RcsB-dependent stress response